MIVLPHGAAPAARWLADLVRLAVGATRPGDRFDDDLRFDPDAVLRLAVRHRVAPLLHRAADEGRIGDPLPASFLASCAQTYYATLRKNVIALDTGRDVATALASAGIDVAPLGGWALLEEPEPIYADAGLRPMDDLDLIVRHADRVRAAAVLRELGFAPTTARVEGALAGGHEVAFHRRTLDVDLFLALHWAWAGSDGLMRGFGVSGDQFLDHLCAPRRAPRRAFAPTRFGSLLFGAVHGARHAFDRWIWLLDLHRLVTCAPLDWPALVRAAQAWRVRGPLYAGLAATRELLRTPVPGEALGRLAPGPVRRRLLHHSLAVAGTRAARPARVAKLLLGESWWDVARTAWAVVPVPGRPAARGRAAAPRRPVRAAREVAGSPGERS